MSAVDSPDRPGKLPGSVPGVSVKGVFGATALVVALGALGGAVGETAFAAAPGTGLVVAFVPGEQWILPGALLPSVLAALRLRREMRVMPVSATLPGLFGRLLPDVTLRQQVTHDDT